MIQVTDSLSIDESELEVKFVRAGGPGGQHVNKAATAVQLRFDVSASSSLPDEVRERLIQIAGNRMSDDGVLVIEASEHRSQKRNREAAIDRLIELVRSASEKPKERRQTKPPPEVKKRRLEDKRHRSSVKELRRPVPPED